MEKTQKSNTKTEENKEIKKFISLVLNNWKLLTICAIGGVLIAFILLRYIDKKL